MLTMVGLADLVFGIVRRLEFPWGFWEYLLVACLTAIVAFLEWAVMLGFRLVGWAWKNRKRWW